MLYSSICQQTRKVGQVREMVRLNFAVHLILMPEGILLLKRQAEPILRARKQFVETEAELI